MSSWNEGWEKIADDGASVAPSRGVSDITGVELGSVYSGDMRGNERVRKLVLLVLFTPTPCDSMTPPSLSNTEAGSARCLVQTCISPTPYTLNPIP